MTVSHCFVNNMKYWYLSSNGINISNGWVGDSSPDKRYWNLKWKSRQKKPTEEDSTVLSYGSQAGDFSRQQYALEILLQSECIELYLFKFYSPEDSFYSPYIHFSNHFFMNELETKKNKKLTFASNLSFSCLRSVLSCSIFSYFALSVSSSSCK